MAIDALTLSLLFLLLIVFLLFRLRTLGLAARVLLFLLHWLVRLVSRFLLRHRASDRRYVAVCGLADLTLSSPLDSLLLLEARCRP